MFNDSVLLENSRAFAHRNGIEIDPEGKLGFGTDGSVWRTSRGTAVKAFYLEKTFEREVAVYRRLAERGVFRIHGLEIPEPVDHDDELLVLEMTIVQPPFLLDFGKAYVDRPPPYWDDPQLVANARAEWAELFDERWPDVVAVLSALEGIGIYYVDPRPGNLMF